MREKSRFKKARRWLIFWCLFIGIGAVAGATGMLVEPDGSAWGMDEMLPFFQVLPFADILFQNFIFAGFSLLIVNGLTNLSAAILLFCKKKIGIILGGVFGITLMLWICIQFCIFPLNFMSTIYFIFGFLQAITGYAAFVFYSQEQFVTNPEQYKNVGSNQTRLVVYFSRMGYVKRAAYEEAERTGASIYEVKSTERTEGTLGFWWCGRFGMHRFAMPIEPIGIDLTAYDHVTICTPIWVFHLAAPMRAFCKEASGKIKQADYILVHFQKSFYHNAVAEMNTLLGIKAIQKTSICSRLGSRIKIEKENH